MIVAASSAKTPPAHITSLDITNLHKALQHHSASTHFNTTTITTMSLRFNSINNFDNMRNNINRGRAQRTMRSRARVNTGRDNRNTRRNRNSRRRASRRQRAMQHGMTPNARARLGLPQRRQVIRGVETIYIDWGCREELVRDVYVPGQTENQRARMARDLRLYGFMDDDEYPTILDFMVSLPQLYLQWSVLFFVDFRIFNFLVRVWYRECPQEFDFLLLSRIHSSLLDRIHVSRYMSPPHRPTIYYRDPDVSTAI